MTPFHDKAKWCRIRLAFFVLIAPAAALSFYTPNQALEIDEDTVNYDSMVESGSWIMDGMSTNVVGDDALADEESRRDLKSGSGSRDHDDYWRWPDDWFFGDDDDFLRYIGDPPLPTLAPMSGRDVVGFMAASIGVVLGSSGGIGGGGIVVPFYIIVLGLSPRFAIPLGSVTVLGGSLAGLILNLRRRHPLADRPVIDWDLILVMEPLVLVGALFGTILHRVVSEKILTVLLVLLLSLVAHTTLAKAKRMFDAEKRYIEHLKAARWDYLGRVNSVGSSWRSPTNQGWSAEAIGVQNANNDPENRTNSPVLPSSPMRTLSIDSHSTFRRMDHDEKQRILILNPDFVTLRTDLLEQEKVTPRNKILALLGKFSVLMFLNITLGGGAFSSPWGILCGSVAYWVVHVIMVAFLFSSAWAAQVRYSVAPSNAPTFLSFPSAQCWFLPFFLLVIDIFDQSTRIEGNCSIRLCPWGYQMGPQKLRNLSIFVHVLRALCWYVWYRRWYDFRSIDACHGSASSSRNSDVFHDGLFYGLIIG